MNTSIDQSPHILHARMVDAIMRTRPYSPPVEQALRAVPRHAFVPAATPEEAYDPEGAVITKRASDGTSLSCASVPTLVATMLEELRVRPGDRVLEVGAGTGYNAALLAELTGPEGRVTTVDIDPEITSQARRALDATGFSHVDVITADGSLGHEANAPYDRIIVTVGAWDLPRAWFQQLLPGGRIVLPLRWRGQTRGLAFTHAGDRLDADWNELCGFVPMIGQDGERQTPLDTEGHVTLYFDADQTIDPSALHGALTESPTAVWSGATIGPNESFDGVWLRLTSTESGVCRIAADASAVQSGLCRPAIPLRSPALVAQDSLAYLAIRRLDEHTERWELGAHAHGPQGHMLAQRLCELIRLWDGDRMALPRITAYPSGSLDPSTAIGHMIDKPDSQLVISY